MKGPLFLLYRDSLRKFFGSCVLKGEGSFPHFLIYCCIANRHRFSDLKQHMVIISYCVQVRHPGTVQLGPLLWLSPGCSQALDRVMGSLEAQVRKDLLPSSLRLLAGLVGQKSPSCC